MASLVGSALAAVFLRAFLQPFRTQRLLSQALFIPLRTSGHVQDDLGSSLVAPRALNMSLRQAPRGLTSARPAAVARASLTARHLRPPPHPRAAEHRPHWPKASQGDEADCETKGSKGPLAPTVAIDTASRAPVPAAVGTGPALPLMFPLPSPVSLPSRPPWLLYHRSIPGSAPHALGNQ